MAKSDKGYKIDSHVGVKDCRVHPTLQAYLGYCLYKAALTHRSKLDEALSDYGLIGPQLGLLCLLHSHGTCSQGDLGESMSIDKATMVKLLDGLESQEFVKREGNPHDRRIKDVSLTAHGKKNFEKLLKLREIVEKDFLSVLSGEEEKQLRKILPKLLRVASADLD